VNGYTYNDTRPRRRRRGCLPSVIIGIVVVLVLAVGADFAARAVAENEAASQIQQAGFPTKPKVTFEGFPFLTQVASRDFHQVRLSATAIPAGPVTITQFSAIASGVRLTHGFNSGTISTVTGTALITFPALSNAFNNAAGGAGGILGSVGMTLSAAGPDEVKTSIDVLVFSGSATWKITRVSSRKLTATMISSSGFPAELVGNLQTVNIPLPSLPYGLTITRISVTQGGVIGQISGQDLKLG
jgi:hypothetical protein